MTKTISARQISLIAFISVFSLKLTVLPSLFYSKVGIDAIFSLFIIMAFDFLELLLIFHVLKKNQDISFYQFLSKKVGKYFAKLILLLIFIYYFFKMLLLCSGGYNHASLAIFKEAPRHLFLFILLVSSCSLYLFKSRSYARTIEFFYPIVATMFVLFVGIALFTAPLQDIRPLLTTPAQNIFESSFMFSVLGGNYLFMLLFMGKIKFGKNPNRTVFGHVVFAWALLMVFYIIDYSIFKYTAVAHPHAISEIIQYLPLPSILGNFDWIAVSFMLVLFVLQGGLFIYCMCYSLNKVFEVKEVEKMGAVSKVVLVFVNLLLLLFIYVVFPTFSDLRTFAFNGLFVPILSSVVMLVPIICFFFELFNNKKRTKVAPSLKSTEEFVEAENQKILSLKVRKDEETI